MNKPNLLSRFYDLSLKLKLNIIFSILIALIALFIFVYFPASREKAATINLFDKGRSLINLTEFSISPSVYFLDNESLTEQIAHLRKGAEFRYVIVTDNDNELLAHFNLNEAKKADYKNYRDSINFSESVAKLHTLIRHKDEVIGHLYLGLSLENLNAEISELRYSITIISLIVFLLGSLAMYWLSLIILRPVSELAITAKLIADGDTSKRTDIATKDEVGQFATSFNQMVDNLELARLNLSDMNKNLEQIVVQRTQSLQDEILERTLVEEALRESEAKFRSLFYGAGIGLMLVDTDGKIVEYNPAFLEMVGMDKDSVSSLRFNDIVIPESPDEELNLQKIRDIRKSSAKIKNSQNTLLWGKITITVIRDKNFFPVYYVVMIEDITKSKLSEERINYQNMLLQTVSQSISLLLTNQDFNAAVQEVISILGKSLNMGKISLVTAPGMLGNREGHTEYTSWINQNNPEKEKYQQSAGLLIEILDENGIRSVRGGSSIQINKLAEKEEYRNYQKERGSGALILIPLIIYDSYLGYIQFDTCGTKTEFDDIELSIIQTASAAIGGALETEKSRLLLIEAKTKAEELYKLKSNFLANMSHELRTPLIGILGYSEMLVSDFTDDVVSSYGEIINKSGNRLLTTLNMILNLSKLESEKVVPVIRPVKIHSLVEECVTLFQSVAHSKQLSLTFTPSSSDYVINIDEIIFVEILNNIINNAIKFTNTGSVTVEINEHRDKELMISVIDTGIGIEESQLAVIFEEFRQASEGIDRNFEGTGLGLTISKRYTELLGGRIEVKSIPGLGSNFTLFFRYEDKIIPGAEESVRDIFGAENLAELTFNEGVKKPQLLLVDDDEINCEYIRSLLSPYLELKVVHNAYQALNVVAENRYDLILMDINLGRGLDGVQLTKEIRKIPEYKPVPIIAITAYATESDRAEFLRNGMNDYLAKPFTKNQLYYIINTNLTPN
ncbi:MAG: response regulator [Ignavibacteriaceae bacterium]|nr:response regulator [Ignavibacteriaceae bacterium]